MKYFIQTFGCQANKADSERIAGMLESRGMIPAQTIEEADHIVINTCMIRESAENRVYGLVNNLTKLKEQRLKNPSFSSPLSKGRSGGVKIIVTGCMVGMAVRDKTGRFFKKIREAMPGVDEFLPIEEVGFDNAPVRTNSVHAWVLISNGCNNFCTYCVVPFTRGREISRPFQEIVHECKHLAKNGFREITLVGQNVNSYGADLVHSSEFIVHSKKIKPVYVKHLGRLRIPTLFPNLLEEVCKIQGLEKVDFISSNPWDWTDELIEVIKKNKKIVRHLHLAVQSGDNEVLRRMNRWYTAEQYIALISKIKYQISNMTFSTDIIVGFPGETEEQFNNTIKLVKQVCFSKAYVSMYSDRPLTAAHKVYKDKIPHAEKRRRWKIIDKLVNQKNLQAGTYTLDEYRNK